MMDNQIDQFDQIDEIEQLQNNGDELWILFSNFLDKIFLYCNKDQDLLNEFSTVHHSNLIDKCLNNSILIKSIEKFTKKIFNQLNSHHKNDSEAEKLRKDGNDLFKEKMFSDALECYSAAILKAKQINLDDNDDRNECSLCYANRSASFFNLKSFKHALDDAECALKLNHYDKDKLNNRIQKCKLVLNQIVDNQIINQLDNNEINDKISLDYDNKKGRKLIANKSIEMGECLIRENAFVSIVNSDYYIAFCNHCCVQLNGYGLPCKNCDYAIYCSNQCLNDAFKDYHKDECGKISDLVNQLGCGYLVLRLAFKVGLENMLNESEKFDNSFTNNTNLISNYQNIYNLMAHSEEFDLKENLSFALVSLFFKQLIDDHTNYSLNTEQKIKLCKLFLRHIQQLSTNLISIDQEVSLDVYNNDGIEMNEKLKVGVAFYPIVSLLNHSCIPNVLPKFNGNRLEITALKLIEENTEILFCYGPSFFDDTKIDRQKMLKDQYFFKCECLACESNEENKQIAFLCGNQCNGAVILNKDKTNFCLNCKLSNQELNIKLYDESLMLIKIAKQKYALKKYEDALVDANEAYNKLIDCVHRHHKELRTCLELLSNCYSELGHYSVSSQYLKVMFKLVKEIFNLKSFESLNIFMRICNFDFLSLNDDINKKEELRKFIDLNLNEFELLEEEVHKKLGSNFMGFEEIKFIKEIRSKIDIN